MKTFSSIPKITTLIGGKKKLKDRKGSNEVIREESEEREESREKEAFDGDSSSDGSSIDGGGDFEQ